VLHEHGKIILIHSPSSSILSQCWQAANKIFAIYIAEKYLSPLNAPAHDMMQNAGGI
jgi:hypothetical protein